MFKCLSIPQHALWMPGIADFTRRFGKCFRQQHFSFKIGVIDHKVSFGFCYVCNSKKNISELKNNIARGKIAFNRTTGRSVNVRKMCARRAQDVCKMCARCVQDVCKICARCVQGVFNMCARCLQGVFNKCARCMHMSCLISLNPTHLENMAHVRC